MVVKKYIALVLVFLIALGQALTAFAQVGFDVKVNFDGANNQATVSGIVYSKSNTELAELDGATANSTLLDSKGGAVNLSNPNFTVDKTNVVQDSKTGLYFYKYQDQAFNYQPGEKYDYSLNLGGTSLGNKTITDTDSYMPEGGPKFFVKTIEGESYYDPGCFKYIFTKMGTGTDIGLANFESTETSLNLHANSSFFDKNTSQSITNKFTLTFNKNTQTNEYVVNAKFVDAKDYSVLPEPNNLIPINPLDYNNIEIFLTDEMGKPINTCFIDFDPFASSSGGEPTKSNLQSVSYNFDGINNYVEFKTPLQEGSSVDLQTVNMVRFELKGMVPDGFFSQNNINIKDIGIVTLSDVNGNKIATKDIWGAFNQWDEMNGGMKRIIDCGIQFADQTGLNYDTSYRINFSSGLMDVLMKEIGRYTFVPAGVEPDNLRVEVQAGDAWLSGTNQINNADITNSTTISMKQLKIGSFAANKNYISYDADFTGGFSDVKKAVLAAEGNWKSNPSVDSSKDINTFGNFENVTTAHSITSGGNETVKMEFTLSSGQQLSNIVNIQSYGLVANEFSTAVRAYWWNGYDSNTNIDYSNFKGSRYILIYDLVGNVIGWSTLGDKIDEQKMYTNPQMSWSVEEPTPNGPIYNPYTPSVDEVTKLPLFVGFDNQPRKFLKIANSGTWERLMLQGTVKSGDLAAEPFQITMDSREEGSKYASLDFWDIASEDFSWSKVRVEGQDSNWFNSRIPINSLLTNTITLSYSYDLNGTNYKGTVEFLWKPDSKSLSDKLLNGFLFEGNSDPKVGTLPDKVSITMSRPGEFLGDINNLKLKMYYNGQPDTTCVNPSNMPFNENTSTVCATLSVFSWEEKMSGEELRTYVTFKYDASKNDIYTIDSYEINGMTLAKWQESGQNRTFLGSMLLYDNGELKAIRDTASGMKYIEVDAKGPSNIWTSFKGQNSTIKNQVKVNVWVDDFIDMQSVSGNVYLNVRTNNGEIIRIDPVEGSILPVHENNQQAWEPYRGFSVEFAFEDLGILANSQERQIVVGNIKDILGNISTKPMCGVFYTDTRFKAYVYDHNGSLITNSKISFIKNKPEPIVTEDPNYNWNYEERTFDISSKGTIDGCMRPGKYYGYKLSVMDEKGQWVNSNVEFEFDVPFVDSELSFYQMPKIQLNPANVTGKTLRSITTRSFKEELVFIEEAIYTTNYSTILADIEKDKVSGMPVDFSKYDRALKVIDTFYVKNVRTDNSGNFSIYLKPGNYIILGKKVSDSGYIEPVSSKAFTVTETGYTFKTPIEFPPPVLTGKLLDFEGKPIINCTIDIGGQYGHYNVNTDDAGYFEAYIKEEGNYNVNSVRSSWDSVGAGMFYSISTARFDVVKDGDILKAQNYIGFLADEDNCYNLKMPQNNLAFKLGKGRDTKGALIQAGKQYHSIRIAADGQQNGNFFEVDVPSQNGSYMLYIPEGQYNLKNINSNGFNVPSYWDPSTDKFVTIKMNGVETKINETILDGNAQFEGYPFTVSSSVYNLIEIDVSGYFDTVVNLMDDDGNPMSNVNVGIQSINDNMWYNAWTDASGNAYFYFGIDAVGTQEVTKSFKLNGYESNGKWYQLSDNSKYSFAVSSNNKPYSKALVKLTIPKPNFVGTLYNNTIKDGQLVVDDNQPVAPIESGWINIKKLGTATEQEKYFNTGTDVDGNFTMSIGEVGQYIVENAGFNFSEGDKIVYNNFEIAFRFDVVLDGTKYKLVYPNNPELAVQIPLVLGRPAPNFYGYVLKTAVYKESVLDAVYSTKYQGFDGTETYLHDINDTGIYLELVEDGISQEELNTQFWKYQKRFMVQKDGSFKGVLDATKTYKVWSVSTPRRWYDYSSGKILIDPKKQQEYVITPPPTNFGGQVSTFDQTFAELRAQGIKFKWGSLNLEKIDKTSWEWAEIDEDGFFRKDLEVGATYRINNISFQLLYPQQESISMISKDFNFRVDKIITIGNGTENLNLRPNFKAVINGLDINTDNIWNNRVGVTIRRVLAPEDAGYEEYIKNPWIYDTYVDGVYTPADTETPSKVEAYGFIEESTESKTVKYSVVRVQDTEINEIFEVKASTVATESGDGTITVTDGRYQLDIDFESNVKGYVKEDGNPVIDAWINIQKLSVEGNTTSDSTVCQWYNARTNADGEFGLKLDDGKYRIDGYSGQGRWESGIWKSGQWVRVDYEFQVIDGVLKNSKGDPIQYIDLAANVTGKIMKPDKTSLTGYTQVIGNAWLQVWPTDDNGKIDYTDWSKSIWANTDATGIFKMTLLPGKYKVTEVGGMNFNMRVDVPFVINTNNQLVVASEYLDGKYFIVKPQRPNLFGTAYKDAQKSSLLVNGQFVIKPKGASQEDWSNAKWIKTDLAGKFNAVVDKGEWIITEIGSWNFWEKVSIPFTVDENGNATSTASGFTVAGGEITIYPPEPNVKGIILNKENVQLNDKGWVVIKPSTADEYDWSKAIWNEYKYYSNLAGTNKYQFRVNLEPGSYKIVEVGGQGIFYKPNLAFVVGADSKLVSDGNYIKDDKIINVRPPEPNIKGIVYADINGVERPVKKGFINIARFVNDVQVTMDGQPISERDMKDPFSGIYWQHTMGFEIDEAGMFEANLKSNATYRVISVGGEGIWYQPNTKITLTGSEKVNVEIRKPGPNVTITIKDVPTNMLTTDKAWLDIYMEKDGFKEFIPATFKEKTINNEFVFKASMKDGTYKVNFFGTSERGIEIDTVLQVAGTTSLVISLANNNNHTMVQGTVTKGGTAVNKKVWVAVTATIDGKTVKKKAQTDENGKFMLKLPKNTVWALAEVVTAESYIGVENPRQEETISTGTQNSLNWNIEINDIIVK